jgi:hypothetical protein
MKKNNIVAVVVVIALLAVGIGMNYYWEQNTVMLDDDGNPVPKATAQTTPPPAPTPPVAPVKSGSSAQTRATLPTEVEFGNPKATTVIGLGYTMDPTTEAHPEHAEELVQMLTAWSKSHPEAEVKVVSEDLPSNLLTDPTDKNVPLGLSINGKSAAGLNTNPGEGALSPMTALRVLNAVH